MLGVGHRQRGVAGRAGRRSRPSPCRTCGPTAGHERAEAAAAGARDPSDSTLGTSPPTVPSASPVLVPASSTRSIASSEFGRELQARDRRVVRARRLEADVDGAGAARHGRAASFSGRRRVVRHGSWPGAAAAPLPRAVLADDREVGRRRRCRRRVRRPGPATLVMVSGASPSLGTVTGPLVGRRGGAGRDRRERRRGGVQHRRRVALDRHWRCSAVLVNGLKFVGPPMRDRVALGEVVLHAVAWRRRTSATKLISPWPSSRWSALPHVGRRLTMSLTWKLTIRALELVDQPRHVRLRRPRGSTSAA